MWSWLTSFWTVTPEYKESWVGKNILVFGKRGSGKSTLIAKYLPECTKTSNENRSEFDRLLESKLWYSANYQKPCQVVVELIDRPSYKLLTTLMNSRHNNLRFCFEASNSCHALHANVDLVVFLDDSGQSLAESLGAAPYSGKVVLDVQTKRYFTIS